MSVAVRRIIFLPPGVVGCGAGCPAPAPARLLAAARLPTPAAVAGAAPPHLKPLPESRTW